MMKRITSAFVVLTLANFCVAHSIRNLRIIDDSIKETTQTRQKNIDEDKLNVRRYEASSNCGYEVNLIIIIF
jgi:hypothetical protein